jgi:hypothetical protein
MCLIWLIFAKNISKLCIITTLWILIYKVTMAIYEQIENSNHTNNTVAIHLSQCCHYRL